jgi:hypothetical protein
MLAVAMHKGNVYIDLSVVPKYFPVSRNMPTPSRDKRLFGSIILFVAGALAADFETIQMKPAVKENPVKTLKTFSGSNRIHQRTRERDSKCLREFFVSSIRDDGFLSASLRSLREKIMKARKGIL